MPSKTPYDATAHVLLATRPRDWLAFLGLPSDAPVTLETPDLSTVSAAADGVLRVGGDRPEAIHIEFESGHGGSELPGRLLRYNVLAGDALRLPVRSIAVLLRKEADSPRLTGRLERILPDGTVYHWFSYSVIRVWQIPAADFFAAGLSLLPLAPIAQVERADLPDVLARMDTRLEAAKAANLLTDADVKELWTAAFVMMGLRYDRAFNQKLLQGVMQMRESVTYQAIVEEGFDKGSLVEARKIIRRVGERRFGAALPAVVAALDSVGSLERLERMVDRLWEVETWEELLAIG